MPLKYESNLSVAETHRVMSRDRECLPTAFSRGDRRLEPGLLELPVLRAESFLGAWAEGNTETPLRG